MIVKVKEAFQNPLAVLGCGCSNLKPWGLGFGYTEVQAMVEESKVQGQEIAYELCVHQVAYSGFR